MNGASIPVDGGPTARCYPAEPNSSLVATRPAAATRLEPGVGRKISYLAYCNLASAMQPLGVTLAYLTGLLPFTIWMTAWNS